MICIAAAALGLTALPGRAADLGAQDIAARLMRQREAARTDASSAGRREDRGSRITATSRALAATSPAAANADEVELDIPFALGSATLTEMARSRLSALCTALRSDAAHGGRIYQIIGHTDASGDARDNLILSQIRAEAVAAWLAGPDCGLNARRLSPVGMGARHLKLPHAPEDAANRRVEIRALS